MHERYRILFFLQEQFLYIVAEAIILQININLSDQDIYDFGALK